MVVNQSGEPPVDFTSQSKISLVVNQKVIEIFQVTKPELDFLLGNSNSTSANFAFGCGGIFVTCVVILLTTPALTGVNLAILISIAFLAFVLGLFFTITFRSELKARKKMLQELARRTHSPQNTILVLS